MLHSVGPMNKFLIDCSFKQYSMVLKFDLLIQRYAILIRAGFTYKFYTKKVLRYEA
jgi:hypothetical protein